MSGTRLILASRSPQRRQILTQLGVDFEIRPADVEELSAGPPEEVVVENAFRKASAVAGLGSEGRVILGVDTVVSLGSVLYGQPRDEAQARETLAALAGREHRVLSGICLLRGDRVQTVAAVTTVEFRSLPPRWLDWYLAQEEWRGRAGGYAIQGRGAALVRRIEGDYLNVVGLPVATLLELAPELIGA